MQGWREGTCSSTQPSTPAQSPASHRGQPSAQLLAPRRRVRGDRKKAGLGQRTALCPSAAETQLGKFHIPSWAFSQNRGCQGGFSASPSDQSSITCSTRLLLASSSPKPDWAAATLRGLGHVPVLCLPTQWEKWAKKPHTRARKKRWRGRKLKSA